MFLHPNGPPLSHRHYKIRNPTHVPRHDTWTKVDLCTDTERTIMARQNGKIKEKFFLSLIDKVSGRVFK
jgi:hypothetical protein